MEIHQLPRIAAELGAAGPEYREFLRVPLLSAGVYVLPAGSGDEQTPHREDEVYYIMHGRGQVRVDGEDRDAAAGTLVYVPAGVEHHFHSISEELRLLVFFAPPYKSTPEKEAA
jgi:mannose-6-phosphate isomerase-like protein (cupin superfamily)